MFPNSEKCFFPCHTARSVKVWMKDHQIRTLSWPAQFPDLNPIKNLWNVIKRKMDGYKPSNKAELIFCARSGIKSPNGNVKDWWRACQDA